MQYLTWAIEHIEKAGNQVAVRHARNALDARRSSGSPHIKDEPEPNAKRIASSHQHRARLCTLPCK